MANIGDVLHEFLNFRSLDEASDAALVLSDWINGQAPGETNRVIEYERGGGCGGVGRDRREE